MWPQITVIVIITINLSIALLKHGEPRTDNHNFGLTLISALIQIALLYYGGFWSVMSR